MPTRMRWRLAAQTMVSIRTRVGCSDLLRSSSAYQGRGKKKKREKEEESKRKNKTEDEMVLKKEAG